MYHKIFSPVNVFSSSTENIPKGDIKEIKEFAHILSIDIAELGNDKNVSHLVKPSQDIVNICVDMGSDKEYQIPRKNTNFVLTTVLGTKCPRSIQPFSNRSI